MLWWLFGAADACGVPACSRKKKTQTRPAIIILDLRSRTFETKTTVSTYATFKWPHSKDAVVAFSLGWEGLFDVTLSLRAAEMYARLHPCRQYTLTNCKAVLIPNYVTSNAWQLIGSRSFAVERSKSGSILFYLKRLAAR